MARILLVEDNAENLELMQYLLTAFGHEALAAHDGEEGLEVARRQRPELVICDIHMPKLDGYGVLKALRDDPGLRETPCIAVTALAMVGDRGKVLAAGFDGYISKPIDPEKFVADVEAVIGILPDPGQKPVTAPSVPVARAVQPVRATVLVVDDSPVNRDLLSHTLGAFGYAVTLAGNVREGLRIARQQAPDLILSDLHMPKEDGNAFLLAVRQDPLLSAVPFIFISSSLWGGRDAIRAMELGATRFLQRPIEPQQLLCEIEAVLPPKVNGNGNDPDR